MRSVSDFLKIYLYVPAVDMRKQLPGLSVLIADALGHDPFSGSLYMFRGRRRDLIKCIYWDDTGFAMWVKRLDRERFPWPKSAASGETIYLSSEQVALLLTGVDIWKIKKHKTLKYEKTI